MAEDQKGIQATYFQDTEYFTLQEAEEHVLNHQKRKASCAQARPLPCRVPSGGERRQLRIPIPCQRPRPQGGL